ncbi:hypothetical protein GCM10023149_52300 [Mucilaginibacter gynuensis]|uniref:Beta-lactamase n=1 Tax=Mucilaginibacter gynuensis TaxID=1302236 RepID=A0ABP8HKP0_9SPHI
MLHTINNRIYSLLLMILFAVPVSAQSLQQRKNDSVFVKVKEFFNTQDAEGIYSLTGESFRKELSADAFKTIATTQLFPIGKINSSTLISFVNNQLSTYKLEFGTVTLQLLMTLDDKDKLGMFLFQPYKETSPEKLIEAATSNPLKTPADKAIDSIARKYIQKGNTVGLSIGILKNGQISTYGYGETTIGNKKLPDANTLFEIGSISKTFTAVLLAYYVNEGKVKLTDPVTKYLPDSVAANPELQQITLLSLSNHTSGLARMPDNWEKQAFEPLNPYKNYNKQLLFAYLKNCKLETKPGEKYAYTNLGVGLLGIALEKISGKSYEVMVKELIAKPLGLKSTVQHITPELAPRFVTVYNAEGKATPAWDFDALASCGALRSTVTDLLAYAKANMQSATGTSKPAKAMELTHHITFEKDAKMGLGWHIIFVDGVNYIFHNGGTYGSSSFLAFNTEKNLAVVVLSNAAESTDGLGTELLKKLQ